ncbi:MBL fold metallo-hydrolase [Anaeroselena agilis]|uniref:MBL fold metallo-hydrolase n=1 Tax=Anaeroselena agilis TaxID=3063788 RepID=A0ABU3NX05_9FIRM|nr:MBL fold metallo-hydrolase [Selenomonadales bacterium 4137-cl]
MPSVKRRVAVLLTALVFMSACLLLPSPVAAQSGLTKIADGVYAYADVRNMSPANSFGANAGVIIGKHGIAVVDTLVSAREADRLIRDIRALSALPVKYAVNTHWHLDHAFGNCRFAAMGAAIIAHDSEKDKLALHGPATLKNPQMYGMTAQDFADTTIAAPKLTFTDRMTIDLGGQRVELIHVAPSHSDGSLLVYLPDKKILFAGDVLFTGYHAFAGDGDIDGWLKTLDYILDMDVALIIPGHGPVSSKNDVIAMKEYLITLDAKAKELCARSDDVAYITAELLKALPPRAEGAHLIQGNIVYKYLKKN